MKDLNLLDPFCLTERKLNKSLERQLIFPRNPTDNVQKLAGTQKSLKQKRKSITGPPTAGDLISMVAFCHERNVPFCENEKRFYDLMRSKQ